MKTTLLLAAAAIASMSATGCQDDQALGTERSRELPEAPAPIDMPPERSDTTQSVPTADTSAPRMPSETPDPQARRAWDRDYTGSRAASLPQVMNGEDLDSIPDLNEPIWAAAPGVENTQRTPMESKGKTQVLGTPGEPR
jgi:hypothetical protein